MSNSLVLRPFTLYDFEDEMLSSTALFLTLPLRELLILSSLHPDLRRRIRWFILRRFVSEYEYHIGEFAQFREWWRPRPIYLTGASALHFITQSEQWKPSAIDFVTSKVYVEQLIEQFVARSFVLQAVVTNVKDLTASIPCATSYALNPCVDAVHVLYRVNPDRDPTVINIIESTSINPLSTVANLHSTQIMNYLTADHIVSLYPDLTFASVGVVRNTEWDVDPIVEKWERRGFEMFYTVRGLSCHRAYGLGI